MARRLEIGASLAAAALALATLLAALYLPLAPVTCPAHASCVAPFLPLTSGAVRVEPAVWLYVALMALLTFTGALGGLLDGRPAGARDDRRGLALLGASAALALGGCALGALGVFGSLYLPSIVALLIAVVAAYARRRPLALPARPRGESR